MTAASPSPHGRRDGSGRSVDGILNVDKPPGVTSMEVVRRIKRASRMRKVGHGGTLDPMATGTVPICLGQATRLMEHLINHTKEYRGAIELGVETDTYDAVGTVVGRADASGITPDALERAILSFTGSILQVPPMYSALKWRGKRLYDLARSGIEVEREPRRVDVLSMDILDWSPPVVTLEITCGRGFYVRSLAHDLGEILGCGGHLKSLVRLRTGPFNVSDAIPLEEAERRFADGTWQELIHPPDVVLRAMRAMVVSGEVEEMIRHGRALPPGLRIPFSKPGEESRVYGLDGGFLAILTFDAAAGRWQPDKVFAAGAPK